MNKDEIVSKTKIRILVQTKTHLKLSVGNEVELHSFLGPLDPVSKKRNRTQSKQNNNKIYFVLPSLHMSTVCLLQ